MQAKYPPPAPSVQFYFTTECGRIFQWAAVDYESLIIRIHEKGYRAKEIRTLDEQQELEELMEMSKAFLERELKESA